MDLRTRYLGLELRSPLMGGASPLADRIDDVRRLEDAGAGAIVLRSLFEEQIEQELDATDAAIRETANSFAEAQSMLPSPSEFALGPDAYLSQIRRIKAAVTIPVIASLNGTTAAGWLSYAQKIAEAGADALELNIYYLATDPQETGAEVEQRTLDVVAMVRDQVKIPIAVKLSPFYSSMAHFTAGLDRAGVDGMVLFNRFYQPDIDIEALEVVPRLHLSSSAELALRLRWLALLSGRLKASLACSGGVHDYRDVIRAIMAGADVVQMASALLKHGPVHLTRVQEEMVTWMQEHDYSSVDQMRGSMNLLRCPDPGVFERGNYMRILSSWRPR